MVVIQYFLIKSTLALGNTSGNAELGEIAFKTAKTHLLLNTMVSDFSIPAIILCCILLFVSSFAVMYFLKVKKFKETVIENNSLIKKGNKTIDNLTLKNKLSEKQVNELSNILKFQKEQIDIKEKEIKNIESRIDEQVLKKTSELHSALEVSEESNRLKEAFLEKISREIRTPLNSILGFINLLSDPNLSTIDREYYLKFIRSSGSNLLSLIDNIVDFTKLETGEFMVEYKKCNLIVLLTDLIDKYRSRIIRENSDISIVFNKPEIVKESLADCKRILHVVDQLLNNAIKYTDTGKVELSYSIANGYHIFKIIDTGIGINQKFQEIIFERFYQIETESRDVFQGAGLGLTIAKGISNLLGGELELESIQGKGATFTLKVPYKEIESSAKPIPLKDLSYIWKDKTILIAEDEDSNFYFLEAILKKTQVQILRANDGVKFLEVINENKDIDLVLLDIKMPGINGFNAIKVVRQQNIRIPVIAQTAFNQPEDKQKCLDSGCNDYLAKPIDRDLLLSKIAYFFNN